MIPYPHIDPVLWRLGPLRIHWYGLMYLFGFMAAYCLGRSRAKRSDTPLRPEQMGDALFDAAMGVIVGGRLGYVLFYQTVALWHDPWMLFRIWEGGMSFHGGLCGVVVAMWWFAKRHRIGWFAMMDFVAPLVPIGLGLGRLGNFINGELWGRVTTMPWGMVFPSGGPVWRHPSQLYEFFLEGVVLFSVVWWYSSKPRVAPRVSAVFLLGYGLFRLFVECFRQPDTQLGYFAFGWLTMGQLLSIPMIILGMVILIKTKE